jgi:hypothetical protein
VSTGRWLERAYPSNDAIDFPLTSNIGRNCAASACLTLQWLARDALNHSAIEATAKLTIRIISADDPSGRVPNRALVERFDVGQEGQEPPAVRITDLGDSTVGSGYREAECDHALKVGNKGSWQFPSQFRVTGERRGTVDGHLGREAVISGGALDVRAV